MLSDSHRVPKFQGVYHEPFAGSLAVYFWIVSRSDFPFHARLADINLRLVRTYQEIKAEPVQVWEGLRELIDGFERASDASAFYYRTREDFNANYPRGDAPRFMFLMATGWNGVYRTNSSGKFNVPFGNNVKTPRFPTKKEIEAASMAFEYADIRACSWETSLSSARQGDFIFLDPPYLTDGDSDSDIYDGNHAFGFADQEKLAVELSSLQIRGIDFLLTNGYSPKLVELYRDFGLAVDVIASRRSISSKGNERGETAELVVTPGNLEVKMQDYVSDFDLNFKLLRRDERNE